MAELNSNRPPVRRDVEYQRRPVVGEEHVAGQIAVDQLVRRPDRPARSGQRRQVLDRRQVGGSTSCQGCSAQATRSPIAHRSCRRSRNAGFGRSATASAKRRANRMISGQRARRWRPGFEAPRRPAADHQLAGRRPSGWRHPEVVSTVEPVQQPFLPLEDREFGIQRLQHHIPEPPGRALAARQRQRLATQAEGRENSRSRTIFGHRRPFFPEPISKRPEAGIQGWARTSRPGGVARPTAGGTGCGTIS